jgi:flagellar motor switch protein FliN
MEPLELPELTGAPIPTQNASLEALTDIDLDVRIDLGRAYVHREDLLRLGPGAIVPLDKAADEPVDVFAGGRLIARGQVVVLDGKICVRVTEMVTGMAAV